MEVLWGDRLVEGFLSAGQIILCIDGFEEVRQVTSGDDEQAIEYLRDVCAALPIGTKFVLACRATHFGSIDRLLNAAVWRGLSLGEAFEVLALEPFTGDTIATYLDHIRQRYSRSGALRKLMRIVRKSPDQLSLDPGLGHWHVALWEAVRICAGHPGLLSAMCKAATKERTSTLSPLPLLNAALVDNVIAYNIEMGKASDTYETQDGGVAFFGTQDRVALLGDIAWHMAQRGEPTVDLADLPPILSRYYGVETDVVKKDIRTHTLLEVQESASMKQRRELVDVNTQEQENTPYALRFSIRPTSAEGSVYFPQQDDDSTPTEGSQRCNSQSGSLTRAVELTGVALRVAPVGVTSVSGAYLLAKHIASTLEIFADVPMPNDSIPQQCSLDRLRPLGDVPLAPSAAGILREMLAVIKCVGSQRQTLLDTIVANVVRSIGRCVGRGDLSVFSPCLRYLGHNLEAMGLIQPRERLSLDPWCEQTVQEIIRRPMGLPDYAMVLVPDPDPKSEPESFRDRLEVTCAQTRGPVLLGVREVTNQDFLTFLQTADGIPWRVEEMTVAGSGAKQAPSRFAQYANEYYLYFWSRNDTGVPGSPQYLPTFEQLNHPVVYVSWYASVAFCLWLSVVENLAPGHCPVYLGQSSQHNGSRLDSETGLVAPGYRLPTVYEWSWAARGGRLDVRFPWELFPLSLSDDELKRWDDTTQKALASGSVKETRDKFVRWRNVYKEVLRSIPKEHMPVLSDPIGPMGTSGLMGNVKEWCHDRIFAHSEQPEERAILGSAYYLGNNSFSFDYGVSLFPRNTNPDVGFRICRPLSEDAVKKLREVELRLKASLGPDGEVFLRSVAS